MDPCAPVYQSWAITPPSGITRKCETLRASSYIWGLLEILEITASLLAL